MVYLGDFILPSVVARSCLVRRSMVATSILDFVLYAKDKDTVAPLFQSNLQ